MTNPNQRQEITNAEKPGYGANADGQFGPNTRIAIKNFQLSIGAQPSGFLSNEQRLALLETPEERESRVARVAAQEKAKQEALEAQRRVEEQANQAAIEQEKKRLEAEEQAKHAAIEREKKRLEDEAAKAAEWREKIDEAQKKGAEYASATDLKWSLRERTNPMTDGQDYTVSSTQTNGAGATAVVEGICSKDQVVFEATLHDANDPKVPLGFSKSSEGGIIGNKRINDYSHFAASFPFNKWSNRIVISRQSFRQDDPESADVTWRVLAEIETSLGTLYIRLPMLDAKIQKLIAACKYHSEVEKRKLRASNTSG